MKNDRKPQVAIIGRGQCSVEEAKIVSETAKLLAENGFRLICGGLGGTMEAAAKGFKEGGGETVGILPGKDSSTATEYIDVVISSGMGEARNVLIVRSADIIVAFPGKYGTLSEIAFALVENKPIISLGSWDIAPEIRKVSTPQEAVDMAMEIMNKND